MRVAGQKLILCRKRRTEAEEKEGYEKYLLDRRNDGSWKNYHLPGFIARIGLYEKLDPEKIDVSHITSEQAAERIIHGERKNGCRRECLTEWQMTF